MWTQRQFGDGRWEVELRKVGPIGGGDLATTRATPAVFSTAAPAALEQPARQARRVEDTRSPHGPDKAANFRARVGGVDAVQEAYSLTGDADYLLKVVLRDLKSLSDIVNNVLMPHQSVAHVRSSIVLDRLKESARLPLQDLPR